MIVGLFPEIGERPCFRLPYIEAGGLVRVFGDLLILVLLS